MMNNVGLIWSNLSEPEIDTLNVDVRDSEYINFQNGPLVCSLFMHDLMHLIHSPAVSVFLDFVHYFGCTFLYIVLPHCSEIVAWLHFLFLDFSLLCLRLCEHRKPWQNAIKTVHCIVYCARVEDKESSMCSMRRAPVLSRHARCSYWTWKLKMRAGVDEMWHSSREQHHVVAQRSDKLKWSFVSGHTVVHSP